MLSHNRFRMRPLLRTDSTQWHTTGQLWIRWFLSLADGARAKEVSSIMNVREGEDAPPEGIGYHYAMQILGLSDSTPRTESRLKTLFWPTIRNECRARP